MKTLATTIVKKLVQKGYTAYFAGGCVRDLLLGHDSADIDIATSAKPEEILSLFPKTFEKGKAFGVIGGGETLQAMEMVKMGEYVDLISTGGGAMLEFLAGKKLPGLKALTK